MSNLDYHNYVAGVAARDVDEVLLRDEQYQGSWQKRGGSGVFANLARKWDRIEAACSQCHYDLMIAFLNDPGSTGLIDDIRDLRRYLLLTEAWLIQHGGLEARQDRRSDSQTASGVVRGGVGGAASASKSSSANSLYDGDPHDQ